MCDQSAHGAVARRVQAVAPTAQHAVDGVDPLVQDVGAEHRPRCGSLLLAVVVIVKVDGVRVAQGPQPVDRLGGGEAVTAQAVHIPVLERGQPCDVLVLDVVALGTNTLGVQAHHSRSPREQDGRSSKEPTVRSLEERPVSPNRFDAGRRPGTSGPLSASTVSTNFVLTCRGLAVDWLRSESAADKSPTCPVTRWFGDGRGVGSAARADQRSPAKRSFSGTAAPVASWTRTKVSMPINSPNLSLPILRKKMFSP